MVSCVLLLVIAFIIILIHLDWKWQVSITYLDSVAFLTSNEKDDSAVGQTPTIWRTSHRIYPNFYQCSIPSTYCLYFLKKTFGWALVQTEHLIGAWCQSKKKKLKTTKKCHVGKFLKIYRKRRVTKILFPLLKQVPSFN